MEAIKPTYQLLREFREKRGITQTHVAKKLNKSPKRISALETGEIKLSADELVEICVFGYDITPAIFFADVFSEQEIKDPHNPIMRETSRNYSTPGR